MSTPQPTTHLHTEKESGQCKMPEATQHCWQRLLYFPSVNGLNSRHLLASAAVSLIWYSRYDIVESRVRRARGLEVCCCPLRCDKDPQQHLAAQLHTESSPHGWGMSQWSTTIPNLQFYPHWLVSGTSFINLCTTGSWGLFIIKG